MLAKNEPDTVPIVRAIDAKRINEIFNHPAVKTWVEEGSKDTIDVSSVVSNPNNHCLLGEFGVAIFLQVMPGIYELHSAGLPEGRGAYSKKMGKAALRYIFTTTPAFEVLTRVPHGHIAAKVLTQWGGFSHEFTRPKGCIFRGRPTDLHVWGLRIFDWLKADDEMERIGEKFHDELNRQAKLLVDVPPHTDDPNHNRYVGATISMCLARQVVKGVNLYNRWAFLSRHETISVLRMSPLTVKIDHGLAVTMAGGEFTVSKV